MAKERNWKDCARYGCPVIIDDLESNRCPGLCDRCNYFEKKMAPVSQEQVDKVLHFLAELAGTKGGRK